MMSKNIRMLQLLKQKCHDKVINTQTYFKQILCWEIQII